MLKLFYATEAEIPADQKAFYTQAGDGWHLNIEGGAVPRTKLDEFRTNNTTQANKIRDLEAQLAKFEGLDPEKARALSARAADIESGELIKKGDVDKVKESVKNGLVEEHTRQLQAVQRELKETQDKLATSDKALSAQVIDNSLMLEARKIGLLDGSDSMLLPYARGVWKLENGKPVAYDAEGKIFGRTGDPITMVEWLERFSQGPGKPLFKPNSGTGGDPGKDTNGGSGGQNRNAPYTGKNPWKPESRNITEQNRIATQSPTEAKRLAAEAGITLRI